MRTLFLLIVAVMSWSVGWAEAHGKAEHVVVVVWDGMRPDFITPQYTPTLFEFAMKGTFFGNNHAAFISTTEVNGTALATGMQPDHSGIMANTEYRPELSWQSSYGTESLDAVRRGDLLTQGHYLGAATVPEILQRAGFPTMIAGAKPIALLHDRSAKKSSSAEKDSVTLFRGQTLPRSVLETLVKARDIGAYPVSSGSSVTNTNSSEVVRPGRRAAAAAAAADADGSSGTFEPGSANTPDAWTTKALVRGLWKNGVPKYSLLWLSEPDSSQHSSGVGSDAAVAALASSDTLFRSRQVPTKG